MYSQAAPSLPFTRRVLVLLSAVFISALMTGPVLAAERADAIYMGDDASYCEIFQGLSDQVPEECGTSVRQIRKRGLIVPHQPLEFAVAVKISFDFDSNRLTPQARQLLDRVAAVLKNDLMSGRVLAIEGHTDSVGPARYNLNLSQRRAQAVQAYLHRHHGIDVQRIPAMGRGETYPFDRINPKASINRRVEFITKVEPGAEG